MALLAQQPCNGCCSRIFPHPHISSGASVAAHGNGKTESPSVSAADRGHRWETQLDSWWQGVAWHVGL